MAGLGPATHDFAETSTEGVAVRHQEPSMAVTLQKWGNSVGVRLPKPMLEQVGLKEGAQVDVLVEGNHLVIRRKRLKLADLLEQCKPENRPDPIDWGPDVGREIIRD
jgi:antitoxin MazE